MTSRRRFLTASFTAGAAALTAAACGIDQGPRRKSISAPVSLTIVGIITEDIATSLHFYRQLGLDLPQIDASAPGDSYRLRTPDNHVIFWETPTAIHTFDPTRSAAHPADRRIVLEFGFSTPGDLNTAYAAFTSTVNPGHLAPFDQGSGVRYAIVTDPDGNQISLGYPAD